MSDAGDGGGLTLEDAVNAVKSTQVSPEGTAQALVEAENQPVDLIETEDDPDDPLDKNADGVMDVLEEEDEE